MLRGIQMPSPWSTTTPSVPIQTLCSWTHSTLSSSLILKIDEFSFGVMEVSIQPQRLSLISPILRVYSWTMRKRSSSTTDIHWRESRDGHRMEHNFHHQCQSVRCVLDSSLIPTINSTVLNAVLIKCCANHCKILRVQQWLWREQVVKDRRRLRLTVLPESLWRINSICMLLITGTIVFNCFVREKSMQQRWRSMEQMEQ